MNVQMSEEEQEVVLQKYIDPRESESKSDFVNSASEFKFRFNSSTVSTLHCKNTAGQVLLQ